MQQHWEGYMNAIGQSKVPQTSMPQVAPFENTSSETRKTGFMDLLVNPVQQKIQARYDAMSGSWEGVDASEANVSLFKTEHAPLKQDKKEPNKK
jgi:hypothetical protein